jgi:hypothetical protein
MALGLWRARYVRAARRGRQRSFCADLWVERVYTGTIASREIEMLKVILALVALAWAVPASAQSCSEIRFAKGAVSGEVSGQVSDGYPLCFQFGTGAGQTVRLQLFGSGNTCFGVSGVIDCQDDFSFRTQRGTYYVNVSQLFRNNGAENFTLRLTIR